MYDEKDIISRILDLLPKSKDHLNSFFESDAEILSFAHEKLLFSIDEFSQEDLFRDDDPYILGWNVAVGTISDILASGGNPIFFAHNMTINQNTWDKNFLDSFIRGIADVLKEYGAGFIGGDFGKSDTWRYTGVVIGGLKTPLSRKGALVGDSLFMTGKVGMGNLEAAMKLYSEKKMLRTFINKYRMRLCLRLNESDLIRQYATSCIDSSDGVLNAIDTIADLNAVGYELKDIPFIREGIVACNLLSKPKILLLLGECGEYELVFTIRKENEAIFLQNAKIQQLKFHKLGTIKEKGTKLIRTGDNTYNVNDFSIRARDFNNPGDYLDELINYAKYQAK